MAETILATASERQVWVTTYFQEYVRQSRFMPYMTNADLNKGGIILTKFQAEEEAKRTINIPFIGRLKSTGVTGSQTLDGQEEELTNFNCPITIDWRRNAVRLPKSTTFRTEINLWDAAKDALRGLGIGKAARRHHQGALRGGHRHERHGGGIQPGHHRAAEHLGGQQFRPGAVRLAELQLFDHLRHGHGQCRQRREGERGQHVPGQAHRQAGRSAHPPVPRTAGDGREFYVAFHGARTFRDLKADTTMVTANTQARARESLGMEDNPHLPGRRSAL